MGSSLCLHFAGDIGAAERSPTQFYSLARDIERFGPLDDVAAFTRNSSEYYEQSCSAVSYSHVSFALSARVSFFRVVRTFRRVWPLCKLLPCPHCVIVDVGPRHRARSQIDSFNRELSFFATGGSSAFRSVATENIRRIEAGTWRRARSAALG